MNRYTQLSSATYTPQSIQELTMAPAYLRGKHDESLAVQEAIRSQMALNGDVLQHHTDEFKKYQDEINNMISQESENLSKYGYSQQSGANLSRLNRYYQNLTGPTGRIGQMISAKKQYAAEHEKFMEDALKNQKLSKEDSDAYWNKHTAGYTGYDGKGGIASIESLGAPEKREIMDVIKEHTTDLGTISRVLEKNSGAYTARDQEGHLNVYNSSGERIVDTNLENALAALQNLVNVYSDPNSREYKYAEFKNMNTRLISDTIYNSVLSKIKYKETDDRKTTLSVSGVKNLNDIENPSDFAAYNSSIYQDPVKFKDDVSSLTSIDTAISKYEKIVSKGGASNEDVLELKNLKELKEKVNSQLTEDNKTLIANETPVAKRKFNKDIDKIKKENDINSFNESDYKATANPTRSGVPSKPMYYNEKTKKSITSADYNLLLSHKKGLIPNKYKSKELIALEKGLNFELITNTDFNITQGGNSKAQANVDLANKNFISNISTFNGLMNNIGGSATLISGKEKGTLDDSVGEPQNFDYLMGATGASNIRVETSNYNAQTGNMQFKLTGVYPKTANAEAKKIGGVTVKPGESFTIIFDGGNNVTNGKENAVGHYIRQVGSYNAASYNNMVTTATFEVDDKGNIIEKDPTHNSRAYAKYNGGNVIRSANDQTNFGKLPVTSMSSNAWQTKDELSERAIKNIGTEFGEYMLQHHKGVATEDVKKLIKYTSKDDFDFAAARRIIMTGGFKKEFNNYYNNRTVKSLL